MKITENNSKLVSEEIYIFHMLADCFLWLPHCKIRGKEQSKFDISSWVRIKPQSSNANNSHVARSENRNQGRVRISWHILLVFLELISTPALASQVFARHKFISRIGLISRWIATASFRIRASYRNKKSGALHADCKRETDAADLLHIAAASLSCLISQSPERGLFGHL